MNWKSVYFFSGGNLPFPWNRYLLDQKTLSWFTISWSKLMACMSMKPPRRNFSNPPMFNRAPTNCVRPIKNMHLAEKQQKKNCVTFSPNLAWGCPWWSKTATKFLVHYNSSQAYFFDISVRYFGQNKFFYIQWLTQTQKASTSYFSPGGKGWNYGKIFLGVVGPGTPYLCTKLQPCSSKLIFQPWKLPL